MPPTLRTPRLLLDAYTPADEEDFVALFQDPRVSRWMGTGTASEAEDRALFGRIFSKVYARELFEVWAVRRGGLLVGHAEIKRTDTVDGHEIVYALAPEAWGGGLGTELAEALVAYGFKALALTEVHATVDARNTASLRLLGRTGFEHVRDVVEDDGGVTRVLTRRVQGSGGKRPGDQNARRPAPWPAR
ncbi:GNAT family N-acetyltransferase [Streptomyces viridochromogenes]|uniref:GNAT family N-acetyltransferase n=1 Tax=Streptomyces viridochromogenes TaxID=1938 RepID=UPI0001B4EF7A|nr:GNAT family N-acetyltransferase [Streptomyces viridochromogenes]